MSAVTALEQPDSPANEARAVAAMIGATHWDYSTESELKRALETGFRLAFPQFPASRNTLLAPGVNVDFAIVTPIARVGIEVHLAGSTARVRRGLQRIAATGTLDVLVLVTRGPRHQALEGVLTDPPSPLLVVRACVRPSRMRR